MSLRKIKQRTFVRHTELYQRLYLLKDCRQELRTGSRPHAAFHIFEPSMKATLVLERCKLLIQKMLTTYGRFQLLACVTLLSEIRFQAL